MYTLDIVKQLQAELPQKTDDFSEKAKINTANQNGTELTIGATLGNIPPINSSITIEGLKLSNAVVSEEVVANGLKLIFTQNHDITDSLGYEQVYLTNTNSAKDGLYSVVEVGEDYLIINTIETGFTALIETRANYNGAFKVKSSNLNEITVELGFTNTLLFYLNDSYIKYGARIYGISLIENISEYITSFVKEQPAKTGKSFLWVLNAGTEIDSDKSTSSDVNNPKTAGNDYKLTKIRNFIVIAVYPTNDSIGGFSGTTKAEELEPILDSCLMGLVLPTLTKTESRNVIMPLSNEPLSFNGGFYSHSFSYQIAYSVSNEDGYKYPTYKFREIELNYKLEGDNYVGIKKTDKITLETEED